MTNENKGENPIKKELQEIIDNSDLTKKVACKETSKGVFKEIKNLNRL